MPLPSREEGVLGGRYRLREPIGRGGTSVVWRAHDRVLDRDVAVKVLADGGERFRQRLRIEASAAGRLRNPHIAHIYDYGELVSADGTTTPYLVMELVDGQPLSRLLADGAALDWRLAVDVGAQVATALAAAHADGLVHRDVKPDNVLLTDDGVKLIDFGISASVGSDDTEADGRVLGTVAYVAPERLAGAPVRPAADVYALGVMLYRMIAGVLPWSVADRDELLYAHLNLDPDPLPLPAHAPAELAEACADCLHKDSSRRPTAAQLAALLPPLARQTGSVPVGEPTGQIASAAALSPAPRPRTRRMLAALAIAAVCVAAVVIGWAGSGGPTGAVASPIPASKPCVATFSVQRDWGRGFDATLTVVNTGPAVHGWRIAFDFTGGQRLTTGAATVVTVVAGDQRHTATLRQTGVTVTASDPQQTLDPQESVTLPVTGRYSATNPIPLDFRLNDRACAAQVAGAAVRPTPSAGGGMPAAGGGAPAGGGGPAGGGLSDQSPGAPAPGATAPSRRPPARTPPAPAPSTTAPPTTAPPTTAPPPPAPGPTGSGPGKPSKSPKPHRG